MVGVGVSFMKMENGRMMINIDFLEEPIAGWFFYFFVDLY